MSTQPISPAEQIKGFREDLGLNQQPFAEELGVSRLAVLNWEKKKGASQPSTETYIRLAKLALRQPKEAKMRLYALRFLSQAGIDVRALRTLVPEIQRLLSDYEQRRVEVEVGDTLYLPLITEEILRGGIRDISARLAVEISPRTEVVVFPADFVPHPNASACLRAPDNLMYPIFSKGDFIAIDGTLPGGIVPQGLAVGGERSARFWARNHPEIVAAFYVPNKRNKDCGLRAGLHIRNIWSPDPNVGIYLQTAIGEVIEKTPANLRSKLWSPDELIQASAVEITGDDEWLILGSVVAWIGSNRESHPRQKKGKSAK
jgi:transcriptional regulator with XRE-family HTH domain